MISNPDKTLIDSAPAPDKSTARCCRVRFGAWIHAALIALISVIGLFATTGCEQDTGAVELTEDEIEQAERRSVERLKELGCKVEYAEDQWLETSGIMVWLAPEHITDEGRIRDDVMLEFRYLRRLFLLVDATPIKAEGLAQLRLLDNLLLLSARTTTTDGKGLQEIEGIVSVRLLRLDRTQVDDDSLRHIERLPELVMLYLSHTTVTDAAVERIVSLKKMTALKLSHTKITNAGVAGLTSLKKLTHLGLDGTDIDDGAIPSLLQFKSLELLDISGTDITTDGLKQLIDGLPDCYIQKLETVKS